MICLEALDSFSREKDGRVATERLQASLSEDLKRAQQDNASSNKKVTLSQQLMKLYFCEYPVK
jgi:kinesin family member C1